MRTPESDNAINLSTPSLPPVEPLVAHINSAPIKSAWQSLIAIDKVRSVMEYSLGHRSLPDAVSSTVETIESLGYRCVTPGICYALASQVFGIQWPLSQSGLIAPRYQQAIVDGRLMLCHALTEENGGSDPLSMRTTATPRADGGYTINGRKAFVTAAPVADLALVFARTDEGRHPFALTAFIIPTDRAGVSRSRPFTKRAVVSVPMGAIDFHDVDVRQDEVVTEEGAGLALLTATTTWERALLMSYCVGGLHRQLDLAVQWAHERTHFERSMGSSPLVASHIADMSTRIHRIRSLIRVMADRFDSGERLSAIAADAAATKISCSEDLLEFQTLLGRLLGARAVVDESGVAVDLADGLAASIYAGTNDLLRITIGRELGLPVGN